MNSMEQIERIKQMEERLERALRAVRGLSEALEAYESVQEDIRILAAYYGSEEWKKDFTDDEQGRLPNDLKRGVLSEDAIWNLLEECRTLKERL